MNYEEFKESLYKEITKIYETENIEITMIKVVKNNDQMRDCLNVKYKDSNISPNIYLDSAYEQYKRGRTFNQIVEKMVDTIEENRTLIFDMEMINRENAFENLYAVVVNAENNRKLLKDVPTRKIDDLMIYPRFYVDENASFAVSNQLLDKLQMTKDEILKTAIKNIEKDKYACRNLYEVIEDMIGTDIPQLNDFPIYMVTNENGIYGANCLASKKILSEITEQLEDDIYIIPCSIHEILVIPKRSNVDIDVINRMISEVNEIEVDPEIRLSDHAYEFRRDFQRLEIAKTKQKKDELSVSKTKHM